MCLDAVSQTIFTPGGPIQGDTHVFLYDGHGSVRLLTDMLAGIAESYNFDAYGNAIGFDPAAALTNLLYSGEHYNPAIHQQYQRARWYDASTGRFNRLDPFAGNFSDPQSLHKYLYTHADPINGIDPSGLSYAITLLSGMSMGQVLVGAMIVWTVVTIGIQTGALPGLIRDIDYLIGSTVAEVRDAWARLMSNLRLLAAEVSKAIAKAAAATATAEAMRRMPKFFILKSVWPEIYEFKSEFLARRPLFYVLNYNGGTSNPDTKENRRIAKRWTIINKGPNPAPGTFMYQVDEYPYASTFQGGKNAEGEWVSTFQNESEGGTLTGFYGRELGRVVNAPFLVIPVGL